jgi:hypothetical protein
MQIFLDELEDSPDPHGPGKYKDFREIHDSAATHPSRAYFILKSIILNNLYGVDIMEEAVEIAKLRLFLKLVAQVEAVDQIEPLPDIDFNIRAGNTLVGFATYDEAERTITSAFDFDNVMPRIREQAEDVERLAALFRAQQTEHGGEITREDKAVLENRLAALNEELNHYLAKKFGVNLDDSTSYTKWRVTHQPFHWWTEFYAIMRSGGFDVVIGNPPYVEYPAAKLAYRVPECSTLRCGNLWAFVLERSSALGRPGRRLSMIVPLSLTSAPKMAPALNLLADQGEYASFLNLSADAHPRSCSQK